MARPLPIRKREDPPDDAAVVIRAGVMESGALGRAANEMQELYGALVDRVRVRCERPRSVPESAPCGVPPGPALHGRPRANGRLRAPADVHSTAFQPAVARP